MNKEKRQKVNAEFSMMIPTSKELWVYLLHGQKNSSQKLSRIEAFYNLIERQYTVLIAGIDETSLGCIQELSRSWHWNRDTTSSFIDTLQRLGAVTCEMDGNRTSVMLNYVIENK
ncbi:MAG: hypothetical protein K5764_03035 [Prevotella sp.]|nr:hypothetical protein [Prevotella sp.]